MSQNSFGFTNITTAATTVLKTGAGTLHRITVNNPGTTFVATIYDNTAGSGTKIGTFTAVAGASPCYDANFVNGLTIVTTGTPGDLTVTYG